MVLGSDGEFDGEYWVRLGWVDDWVWLEFRWLLVRFGKERRGLVGWQLGFGFDGEG